MLSIPLIDKAVTNIFIPEIYDDPFDRIHYVMTSSIIGFFAIMISAKQYIGSPIQCWTYKEFSSSWEQYAEDYCFIRNTYYYPINMSLPSTEYSKSGREINYYQWVPIILSIQAFLFYFPNIIWKGSL
ncbi:Innexin family-containing protein [Strongyloides ratti]|uniref:Innexin n=1 Tax=Strongyloides ratti TaxID=34506 RepID=A0A090L9J8_STRRB|nr:Innexin family-containing protein [Strongyloides ratti]CEF64170.1 Innexin family-containing protein [Strongyloides ratti]